MLAVEVAAGEVVIGVDTHGDAHVAVLTDGLGRAVGTRTVAATAAGYAELVGWAAGYGRLAAAGVEGTGSYGAELARFLAARDVPVLEVNRPDRARRRRRGKTDTEDAHAAARAVLAGDGVTPKARTGRVEAIRALSVVRAGLVKERTRVANQLKDLVYTAPEAVAAELRPLSTRARVARAAAWHTTSPLGGPLDTAEAATRAALGYLATHYQHLSRQLASLDRQRAALVTAAAPTLLAAHGVGIDTAAQLLITAGDNADRLTHEAAFAHLCGVSPLEASTGKTTRHRLNRGGDRQANRALWVIALTRLRTCPTTKDYATRRRAQGKTTRDILRCLKRYIARELFRPLLNDLTNTTLT
jgi:transposase